MARAESACCTNENLEFRSAAPKENGWTPWHAGSSRTVETDMCPGALDSQSSQTFQLQVQMRDPVTKITKWRSDWGRHPRLTTVLGWPGRAESVDLVGVPSVAEVVPEECRQVYRKGIESLVWKMWGKERKLSIQGNISPTQVGHAWVLPSRITITHSPSPTDSELPGNSKPLDVKKRSEEWGHLPPFGTYPGPALSNSTMR